MNRCFDHFTSAVLTVNRHSTFFASHKNQFLNLSYFSSMITNYILVGKKEVAFLTRWVLNVDVIKKTNKLRQLVSTVIPPNYVTGLLFLWVLILLYFLWRFSFLGEFIKPLLI